MKKLMSFVLIICIILLSVFSVQSYSKMGNNIIDYDNTYYLYNGGYAFSIGVSGNDVMIQQTYPSNKTVNVTLDIKPRNVICIDNKLYFIGKDTNVAKVVIYTFCNNKTTEINIGLDNFSSCNLFCTNGSNRNYIISNNDKRVIFEYDNSGNLLNKYSIPYQIYQLITYDGTSIYAISGNYVYKISKGIVSKLGISSLSAPCRMLSENYIIDYSGDIYSLKSNKKLSNVSHYENVAISGSNLFYYEEKIIKCVNASSFDNISYFNIGDNICCISAVGSSVIINTDINTLIINTKEFSRYEQGTENTKSNSQNVADKRSISSKKYTIGNRYITNINASTTIGEFKKNISYTGYSSVTYKTANGKTKKSGNIGTGGKITFVSNTLSKSYILIINGDITSEGNSNTRDISAMFNVLLSKDSLNTVQLMAADMNNDNIINTKDLVLLSRYTKSN